MEYTRKAFYGFLWVAGGAVIANVCGYLLRLYLVRNLTIQEYGLLYAVFAFFGIFGAFQNLGLGEAVVKAMSSLRVKADHHRMRSVLTWAMLLILISSGVIATIFFFSADWLSTAYFKNPMAAHLIRVYAVSFVLSSLGLIYISVFQSYQSSRLYSVYVMLQSVLLLGLTVLFISRGSGVSGVVYAYVTLFPVLYALMLIPMHKLLPRKLFGTQTDYSLQTPRSLLVYGFPVMLTGLGGVFLTVTDTAVLTLFSTLSEVGIYQAALPTASILLVLVTVITVVLFPLVAEMWARKQIPLIRESLRDLHKYALICLLPAVVGIIIFPGILLNLLFGAEYAVGAPILAVLAAAMGVIVLNAINASTLSGIGLPGKNTRAVVAGASANIVLNLSLIPSYGGLGAAIATLISAIIIFAISAYYVNRQIGVRPSFSAGLRIFAAGAGFLLTLHISRILLAGLPQYPKIALALIVASLVYAGLIALLRVVTVEELHRVRKNVWKR